jgi:hypothetical protein
VATKPSLDVDLIMQTFAAISQACEILSPCAFDFSAQTQLPLAIKPSAALLLYGALLDLYLR